MKILRNSKPKVKDAIIDKDMFGFVKNIVGTLVD